MSAMAFPFPGTHCRGGLQPFLPVPSWWPRTLHFSRPHTWTREESAEHPNCSARAAIRRRLGGRKASWSHSTFTHRFAHGGPSLVDAKVAPDKAAGSPVGGAVVGGRGAAVGAATTPRAIAITAADTRACERCGVHKPVTTAGQLMARQCRCVIASHLSPRDGDCRARSNSAARTASRAALPFQLSLGKPRRMGNGSTQCLAGTLGCRSGRFTSPCRFRSG